MAPGCIHVAAEHGSLVTGCLPAAMSFLVLEVPACPGTQGMSSLRGFLLAHAPHLAHASEGHLSFMWHTMSLWPAEALSAGQSPLRDLLPWHLAVALATVIFRVRAWHARHSYGPDA